MRGVHGRITSFRRGCLAAQLIPVFAVAITGAVEGRGESRGAGFTFTVMPGISHASFQQKNYRLVYHILLNFFSQPEPVYRGG